jgi:4a-hydroxytetrahydrobiopterin dehydratase
MPPSDPGGLPQSERKLAEQECEPCTAGTPRLEGPRLAELSAQVFGWRLEDDRQITKTFRFPDFESALDFVDEVGELAEEQGHHPDIHLSYGKVKIDLSTHKISGLSENDFIMAAKIDELAEESQTQE